MKIKLIKDNEKKLLKYIDKNCTSKSACNSNYNELFENQNLNEALTHFYATNNIEESLHIKLNLYLPSKKIQKIRLYNTNISYIYKLLKNK